MNAGIPVTSVPRTLVDLAGIVRRVVIERAVEGAERLGLLDDVEVRRIIARSRGKRGVRQLNEIMRARQGPPPRIKSELERLFLCLCDAAGLPRPLVNVVIEGIEVDMFWPEFRLIVELDGYAFHHTRARFEDDRARDAALQLAGYRVIRITHRMLVERPDEVVRTLRVLLSPSPERPGGAPRAGVRGRRAAPVS